MKLNFGVHGKFRVIKSKGGAVTYDNTFPNVVLDVGFDNFWSNPSGPLKRDFFSHLFLGTGTTAPTRQDAGLEARSGTLAGKGRVSYEETSGNAAEYKYQRHVARFDYGEGEAEGVWTELGLAESTSYNIPFNRSLIKDENGNPISLTILSDEYLTVYYTVEFWLKNMAPLENTGSITFNGQTVNYTITTDATGWGYGDYAARAFFGGSITATYGPYTWLSEILLVDPVYTTAYGSIRQGIQAARMSTNPLPKRVETTEITINPTDEARDIKYLMWCYTRSRAYGSYRMPLFIIEFDQVITKLPDERLVFGPCSVEIAREPDDNPPEAAA